MKFTSFMEGSGTRYLVLVLVAAGLSSSSGAQSVLWENIGEAQDSVFAGGFVPIGDVNGDGTVDFLYGLPVWNRHTVVSGADWSELASVHVPDINIAHQNHGGSVCALGDWDGDGVPDYAVGASGYSPTIDTMLWAGMVRFYSGATHQLMAEITHNTPDEGLGVRVFGLGDITGDGWPEIAIQGDQGLEKLWIYSAPNATLLRVIDFPAAIFDVEVVEDFDGDGCRDYFIGEGGYSAWAGWSQGRVVLMSGATGQRIRTFEGRQQWEQTGRSVAVGGDWNGDGWTDIVAGASGGNQQGSSNNPMGVYVFSGIDGTILRHFDGLDYVPEGSSFGFDVDSGHDVNGDGFPDLIVGAPANSALIQRGGSVQVISGRTGALLWQNFGFLQEHWLGSDVSMIDDHDGDGLDDWVVVDIAWDGQASYYGAIDVYRGAAGDRWKACGTNAAGAGAPSARLFAAGPIGISDNGLQLSVESAPPDTLGFFFTGTPASATPFGQGLTCFGGLVAMVRMVVTDSSGNAWTPFDHTLPPFDWPPLVVHAGDTRAFQFVYRDPASGRRDASDSVVVQFLP